MRTGIATVGIAIAMAACSAETGDLDGGGSAEDEVRVDTSSPVARAQYDANVAFANSYKPRCRVQNARYPRVLVSGYGRFLYITDNATGRTVSHAVPAATYPLTDAPAAGSIDPPGPQLSVGTSLVTLPSGAKVNLCGMILPVYWDLAAILVAKEIDSFSPELVVMNGVAGSTQPLWLELGAMNRAGADLDGSGNVGAKTSAAGTAPLVTGAPFSRGNLLSWKPVRSALEAEIVAQSRDAKGASTGFGDIVEGVRYAGFPRTSNDYLCNNVTYTVGLLMDSPKKTINLLQSSTKVASKPNSVPTTMKGDFRTTPRVFVHWPSSLVGGPTESALLDRAAAVLLRLVDAQLAATKAGGASAPTRGDNGTADPGLEGGGTF